MDERMLLLLGILKAQSQHGYQINEFIEKNLKRVIDMKRSTAYSLLDRLCDQGYVNVAMAQQGNRPPKKVYTLTTSGEEQFMTTLRDTLRQAENITIPFEIGLMFLDNLPPEELVPLFLSRIQQLEQQLALLELAPAHSIGQGVDLSIAHRKALLKAEHDWLTSTIKQIEH